MTRLTSLILLSSLLFFSACRDDNSPAPEKKGPDTTVPDPPAPDNTPKVLEVSPLGTNAFGPLTLYKVSTNIVGELRPLGSCSFTPFQSVIGENQIIFSNMTIGNYNDCKIELFDGAQVLDTLDVSSFDVIAYNPSGFVDQIIGVENYKICPHILETSNDPIGIDPDGDGWGAACEAAAGTDPNNIDTDGDGFFDGVDPWPLDNSLPANTYAKCSDGVASDTVITIPLPAICADPRGVCSSKDLKGIAYSYNTNTSLTGEVQFSLEIPANFNGTVVFNETGVDTGIFNGSSSILGTVPSTPNLPNLQNKQSVLSAGFAYIELVNISGISPNNFDQLTPAQHNIEIYLGHAIEWINKFVQSTYCQSATSSIIWGSGRKAQFLRSRLSLKFADTNKKLTSFSAAYLNDNFFGDLTNLADFWLFSNMVLQSSSGQYTFGPLEDPLPSVPAAQITTTLVAQFTNAMLEYTRLMHQANPTTWGSKVPPAEEEVYANSLYNLQRLVDIAGGTVASNVLPTQITHSLGATDLQNLSTLGFNGSGALSQLNGSSFFPNFTARAKLAEIGDVSGDLQIPVTARIDPVNYNTVPQFSIHIYKSKLSTAGKSQLLRTIYARNNNILTNFDAGELNVLKNWIELGTTPQLEEIHSSVQTILPGYSPPLTWPFTPY